MISLRTSAHHELWHRVEGRWIVGTVDLRVAVQATAALPEVDHVLAAAGRAETDTVLTTDRTETTGRMRRVALLAQQRWPRFQHGRTRGAMHVVAIGAVFSHRVVLVHKGASFLGVAGVAGAVDAVALEQLGAR